MFSGGQGKNVAGEALGGSQRGLGFGVERAGDDDQTLDTAHDDVDAVAHLAGGAGDGESVDERVVELPGDARSGLAMAVGALAGDGVRHPVSGHVREFCRGVGSGREASERRHASRTRSRAQGRTGSTATFTWAPIV